MKKLGKEDQKKLDELLAELQNRQFELAGEIDFYNNAMHEAYTKLKTSVDEFNASVEKLNAFREDVLNEMNEYLDSRSEKWQDSDAGSNYASWIQEWDTEFEEVEIDEPEEFDTDLGQETVEAVENLPREVEA